MGNLICSTLELKMGRTILHSFCLLQVKNKVFFEFFDIKAANQDAFN